MAATIQREPHLKFDLHLKSQSNPVVTRFMRLVQMWVHCFACQTFTLLSNQSAEALSRLHVHLR